MKKWIFIVCILVGYAYADSSPMVANQILLSSPIGECPIRVSGSSLLCGDKKDRLWWSYKRVMTFQDGAFFAIGSCIASLGIGFFFSRKK